MEVMNMFKKTTAAIILSAVIMAGSSVSAFAETPVQTVVVEQEYAASAAKTWDGKAALKAGQKYVIKKNVTVSGKVTLPKGTTLTVKKGAKLTIGSKGALTVKGTLSVKSGATLAVSGKGQQAHRRRNYQVCKDREGNSRWQADRFQDW
mgnify:CR=1 FL=1